VPPAFQIFLTAIKRRNEIGVIVLYVADSLAHLPCRHHVGRKWSEEIDG